ncbi:MAG TPA: hypothetical protein VFF09_05120 [archaeon]|nr:hypothetical protein [archaeon]
MIVGPHKNGTLWPALTALKPIQKWGCGLQALIRFFSAVHGSTFNAENRRGNTGVKPWM